jgi:hypothetical protein
VTIPIWIQYAVIVIACLAIGTGCALVVVDALYEWKWRRRKKRHGGDLIEQLERWTGR